MPILNSIQHDKFGLSLMFYANLLGVFHDTTNAFSKAAPYQVLWEMNIMMINSLKKTSVFSWCFSLVLYLIVSIFLVSKTQSNIQKHIERTFNDDSYLVWESTMKYGSRSVYMIENRSACKFSTKKNSKILRIA